MTKEEISPFLLLLHVHDHIWRDKKFSLKIRRESCELIQNILSDTRLVEFIKVRESMNSCDEALEQYQKVKEGASDYKYIQTLKKLGRWVCDSVDHNESTGCSNPNCFKYNHK